uniref:Uncharacterized protein n=1 Tax=Anguilla anguilla TaxID=7936 RepID=A0A0E9TCS3_ANGAN
MQSSKPLEASVHCLVMIGCLANAGATQYIDACTNS